MFNHREWNKKRGKKERKIIDGQNDETFMLKYVYI